MILMHSMANASFNYLPLPPEFVSQLDTFYFFLAVMGLLAAVVLWRFGSHNLLLVNQSKG